MNKNKYEKTRFQLGQSNFRANLAKWLKYSCRHETGLVRLADGLKLMILCTLSSQNTDPKLPLLLASKVRFACQKMDWQQEKT